MPQWGGGDSIRYWWTRLTKEDKGGWVGKKRHQDQRRGRYRVQPLITNIIQKWVARVGHGKIQQRNNGSPGGGEFLSLRKTFQAGKDENTSIFRRESEFLRQGGSGQGIKKDHNQLGSTVRGLNPKEQSDP